MPKEIIYILQNSFWGENVKTSGGDVRFVSIFRRIQDRFSPKSLIFVNKEGLSFDNGYGLNFDYLTTPLFFDKLGVFFSYTLRTIFVIYKLFFLPRNDIFYSLSDFFPDTIVPFLFKTKKNKWIQVIHHLYLPPNKRSGNKLRNSLLYLLQRFSLFLIKIRADKVIVVSSLLKNQLIAAGFKPKRIFVASNGIEVHYFESLKDENKEFDAVFLGRLTAVKGAFDLIHAWKRVICDHPGARLLVMGGCDEHTLKDIRILIDQYGLKDNINIIGFQELNTAFKYFKKSRLFLFPSHEEGWGIAIAEAMACKLPIICWDLKIYEEIFNGFIIKIKENDVDALAKTVLRYLNNEKECLELSTKAYEFVKKYNWDSVADGEWSIISN